MAETGSILPASTTIRSGDLDINGRVRIIVHLGVPTETFTALYNP